MNNLIKKWLLLILLVLPTVNFAVEKAKVCVIATGGTIAGSAKKSVTTSYNPAVLTVEDIIASVEGIDQIADIEAVQFANISSQNMTSEVLIKLSTFVNETLKRDDISGVVITHGTDTMEESSYFLSLTVDSDSPVVFVGSMRPSSSLSSDGAANLYSAISTAASSQAKGRGVMVVMNDKIFAAKDVVKTNTLNVEAFSAPNGSPIGIMDDGEAFFVQAAGRGNVFDKMPTSLPKVMILYGYVDADQHLVDYALARGYKGIVYCGVGHGNMNYETLEKLTQAAKKGIAVVRSSRVYSGAVTSHGEVDDKNLGFTSAGMLTAQKARLLLALSLAESGGDSQKAIELFDLMK